MWVRQLSKNSHRRSVANSWLSGKSSRPCILPSCHLGRNRSWIVLLSHRDLTCLDLESCQELWGPSTSSFTLSSVTSGDTRSASKALHQVREHTEALELCVLALDVWCRSFPSHHFFFVAPEDRSAKQQHGPASIWQLAEVMAVVKRTREAARSSAFVCELNLCHLGPGLVRGWPKLQPKGDFSITQALFVTAVHAARLILNFVASQFAARVAPLFPIKFWSTVLEATGKALGMAFQFRRKVIKSIEMM